MNETRPTLRLKRTPEQMAAVDQEIAALMRKQEDEDERHALTVALLAIDDD